MATMKKDAILIPSGRSTMLVTVVYTKMAVMVPYIQRRRVPR